MSEWYDSQQKPSGNFRKLLQERIEKANPRRTLTAEEERRLSKLEAIAAKLKRGENVQNRQLQTWLSEGEYEQIAAEWDTQKIFREELKEKPSSDWRKSLQVKQRDFVSYVLRNYVDVGVDELDVGKLSTALTAKYGSLHAAQQKRGTVQEIQGTFVDFPQHLYQATG